MASVNSVEKKYSGDENETEKFVKEEKVSYEYVTIPPDGGFGWIITVASLLCLLISDGILLSFGLILSELRYVFDEPAVKIAWIFSIENATSLISGPIASALSNKFGFRAVVISGSLLGFVGLLTSTFAFSVETLFFTLGVLLGTADGLVYTPIVVGVGFYFDKRRALATGITLCGSGAGAFVFAPLISWLLETYALRGTFLILSGLYLNCAVFGSLLIPVKPVRRKKIVEDVSLKLLPPDSIGPSAIENPPTPNDVKGNNKVEQAQSNMDISITENQPVTNANEKLSIKKCFFSILNLFKFSLFRSPTFVVICASSFFQSIGWFVPSMYITAHAVNMGVPKEKASFLLSILGISIMIGRILIGWISDHPRVSVLLLNNIGLTISGLLILLCPSILVSYELLALFSTILGLAASLHLKNSLHNSYKINFTWEAFGFGKCE
ncbi:monocarboxylate transporter 12-like isoform X2 [Daphnia pulicaria]|uniref:monocarboxylate transporter 12-like isoform X2 n=1 Tax=Daphnia pulicaria TaxID=35523 RepID=UPI001EEAE28C|nr:monocarboxylate transporter 12-like isoform X2 [Daphnia pulicaria]